MFEGPAHCGDATIGQVVLGCIKKQAEKTVKSKPNKQHSSIASVSVLASIQVPALDPGPNLPSHDGLQTVRRIIPFLDKLLFVVFAMAIGSKLGHYILFGSREI